jgi:uncharacterized protein (DUF362 family)
MDNHPLVWIDNLDTGYHKVVAEALNAIGFFIDVPPAARIFLKPNLTFPEYRPGVMTSYDCLEAVVECLIGEGYRVTIGEADSGSYNRFAMDCVFEQMGINSLAERTGARLVNLSHVEPEIMPVKVGRTTLRVPVPRFLLEDCDAFITLPVPKIHSNTYLSLSIKNQWGCIQEPAERLKLHPYFAEVMFEFNRRLPRPYALVDGRFGLNRSGPTKGDVVELNWFMASNDLVAADRVCCRLMQINERRVRYLRTFEKQGWWTPIDAILVNHDPKEYQREKFYLRRTWTDYPGLLCFRYPLLAWLGYRSPLAGALHRSLYLFIDKFYDYEREKDKLAMKLPESASHRA